MTTVKEIRAAELDFNQYGEDGQDRLIDWDGDQIPALVSDVETKAYDAGTDVVRKLVSVRRSDLAVVPDVGDEIRLNLDAAKVDDGDYWRVEKVVGLDYEYDIYFERFLA
jgi:hypothetical protein